LSNDPRIVTITYCLREEAILPKIRIFRMPTYKYRCKECGHEFEIRQRMSEDPLTECPVCHGPIRRVVGSVGIVFKGSGFYVTDNRSADGKGRVKTTDKSTGAAEKGEQDSKTEKTEKPSKSDKKEE
jgi:putative FmdB family regulatory protein